MGDLPFVYCVVAVVLLFRNLSIIRNVKCLLLVVLCHHMT